jgi:hypothetical protein
VVVVELPAEPGPAAGEQGQGLAELAAGTLVAAGPAAAVQPDAWPQVVVGSCDRASDGPIARRGSCPKVGPEAWA